MKNKIVNPCNMTSKYDRNSSLVSGRGAAFYCLNNISYYRRFSLITHGTNYKGFRIVLSKRIYEL